jgi:hypothetical protein
MPVTIREVAQKLGISIATVSHAWMVADIALETRQRVDDGGRNGVCAQPGGAPVAAQKADAISYILPADAPRFGDPFMPNS